VSEDSVTSTPENATPEDAGADATAVGVNGRIRDVSIDHQMRSAYLDYAMSVIVSRALPDARDGMKPVQRRILYVMHDTGARAAAPYRKSARVVGDVLGKYHPHGDQSVYDAMARMAQDFSIRYLLVDGQGNFGSIDGDPPAAMRYTEARLSRVAEELLADLEKDTVDWTDNYDGTIQEPTVLPAALPNLLLNGATGIAVGMATNIPPHNLTELCRAVEYLIDRWHDTDSVTVEDLMQIVPGPDFPTGGMILGREGIAQAYGSGHGRIVMRGVAEIAEMKGGRQQILVTELPYQVNKATLIERIAELVNVGRIEEISDIRDESDRRGMRIVIELKRGAQAARVLNRLYKFTALQSTFSVQCLALVADEPGRNQPRLLSLKRALLIFIEHRREVLRRRSEFELPRARARAHILEGLRIALDFLDRVIAIIRGADDADDAKSKLVAELGLSDVQAQAILDMQLRRLAALERRKLDEEYATVRETIAYLEDLLASPLKMLALIREDTARLAEKYGDERRTRIEMGVREEFDDEELIPDTSVLISLTARGYVKRTLADAYRAQHRGGRGVTGMAKKDEDEVTFLVNARTHDTVLFFSDRGRVYALKAYQITEAARDAKGTYLSNLISLGETEKITAMLPISKATMASLRTTPTDGEVDEVGEVGEVEAEEQDSGSVNAAVAELKNESDAADAAEAAEEIDGSDEAEAEGDVRLELVDDAAAAGPRMPTIAMCTRRGKIKRVDLAAFANIRSSGLIAMTLAEGDELSYVRLTPGDGDLLVVTALGQALRFGERSVRCMGRAASGVRAMRLKKQGDYIAGMEMVEADGFLLTVTEHGYGKRTDLTEYGVKGRGGGGMRTMTSDMETVGKLVSARVVQESDQITVITAEGTAIRQKVATVPTSGRSTRGLRLINLRDGDAVASVARLASVE
jgi:DNA gyrase subunit A